MKRETTEAETRTRKHQPRPYRQVVGLCLALLAAVAFSTEGVLGKLILASGAATSVIIAVRFALGAAFLWGFLALGHVVRQNGTNSGAARQLSRVTGAILSLPQLPFQLLVLIGAAGYTGTTLLIFLSFERLPSGLTLTILYLYPVLVTLGSALVGDEPLTVRGLAAAFVGFAGVAAVGSPAVHSQGQFLLGVLLALGAAVVNAAQLIWTSRLVRYHDPLYLTALYLTYGAGLATLTALILAATGQLAAPGVSTAALIREQLCWALQNPIRMFFLSLVPTAVAVIALFFAINHIGAPRTSLVATTEPPLVLLWGILFLGEQFSGLQLGGAALIIIAIVVLFLPEVYFHRDEHAKTSAHSRRVQ